MNLNITKPISREAWVSALHVKGAPDESLTIQMQKAEQLLLQAVHPKAVYRIMERQDVITEGFSIQKHLEGCHQVVLMAITLGIGVDNLLRRTQVTDMALTVILDTGASVLAEQLCDDFERQLRTQLQIEEDGRADGTDETDGGNGAVSSAAAGRLYMTKRFSPGYGDYPVTEQGRIIRYLDAQRQMGIHVTADSLMIPRKSITALAGIADHPVTGRLAACSECILREKCTLRKEGKFCGN